MKLLLSWIRDYLTDPPDAAELAQRLTRVGMNVELREPVAGPGKSATAGPADGVTAALPNSSTDEVWDVDITSNRPDVMNHRGIAREAAAAGCGSFRQPLLRINETGLPVHELARVTVEDPIGCPRYCARVITGVTVGPSPAWLATRLERCGLRPINNVVDATNYVLLGMGHPLHGFDLEELEGHEIRVRRANPGERMTTLDGVDRALSTEDLVIADAVRPVAVAGVMGGAESEIKVGTTEVLLESAYFDSRAVRRTARRLGLSTEASQRFEKGADRAAAREAVDLAAALIVELAGGEIAQGVLDSNPEQPQAAQVSLSVTALSRFAGCEIPAEYVSRVLDALGFRPHGSNDIVTCTVPSHRVDVELPEDLYEEVLRHYGYDAIPSALPVSATSPGKRLGSWPLTERGRDALLHTGAAEAVTYSFVQADIEEATACSPLADRGGPVSLANPMSARLAVMRRSLLAGLADAAAANARRGAEQILLGEVGRAFFARDGGIVEEERLAIVVAGKLGGWDLRREVDFLDLKGVLETVLEQLGLCRLLWRPAEVGILAPGEAAEVLLGDRLVAVAGRLGGAAARLLDSPLPLYVAEVDLAMAQAGGAMTYRAVPRFPAVIADLTIGHRLDLTYATLDAAIRDAGPAILEDVVPLIRYRGEGVGADRVKTTFRLTYRHPDRSLTQDEVNQEHLAIRGRLKQLFPDVGLD
jgi:phenylalanyl-tRNA synthetase beta chain